MTPKSSGVVVTFVTDQPNCIRLIEAGSRLAEGYGVPHWVISIQPAAPVSEYAAARLQVLYDMASRLGAEMTVLFHENPVLMAAVYLKKLHAIHAVSGIPGSGSTLFIESVRACVPQLPWSVVDTDGKLLTFPPMQSAQSVHEAAAAQA